MLVTSRLGTGKSLTFFYSVVAPLTFNEPSTLVAGLPTRSWPTAQSWTLTTPASLTPSTGENRDTSHMQTRMRSAVYWKQRKYAGQLEYIERKNSDKWEGKIEAWRRRSRFTVENIREVGGKCREDGGKCREMVENVGKTEENVGKMVENIDVRHVTGMVRITWG